MEREPEERYRRENVVNGNERRQGRHTIVRRLDRLQRISRELGFLVWESRVQRETGERRQVFV